MTHITLDAPKTIRFPAIRLPKFSFGKLFTALAGGSDAYGTAKVSAYSVAMGFGAAPHSATKREDDY